MTQMTYPVFVYRSAGGFTVRSPDFPQAVDAFGPDRATAIASAKAAILAELKRMKLANIAPPPSTPIENLVSTKGGSVELLVVRP